GRQRWAVMARNHGQAKSPDWAKRIRDALELRAAGLSQRAIAAQLGVHLKTIQEDLDEGMQAIIVENAEPARRLELDRLDRATARMLEALDEDTETAAKASAALVRLSERRAKLLGLDAPAKVQAEVSDVTH